MGPASNERQTYTAFLGETLDVAEIGGKGASLARMVSAGFPVPQAFSVTADAYTRHQANGSVASVVRTALEGLQGREVADAERLSETIRAAMLEAAIPPEVEGEIRSAYRELAARVDSNDGPSGLPRLSVRSSATAEDLSDASFAGQHDTYLNVVGEDAVLQAVRKCWASLWSAHAIEYRQRQGFPHAKALMSVVVQELVMADTSGVMFTANPVTGDRSEIMINASWGLGEAVVSGLVTPDQIVVSRDGPRVTAMEVSEKATMVTLADEGGTVATAVPADKVQSPSLSEGQIIRLVEMGLALEEHYGAPQDVEWCYLGDRLSLLQSRPITTL